MDIKMTPQWCLAREVIYVSGICGNSATLGRSLATPRLTKVLDPQEAAVNA